MSDTLGNMLAMIRNAQLAHHQSVKVPYSNLSWQVAKVFEKEGFVASAEKVGRKENRVIEITLKYENNLPAIQFLRRISKPGKRVYRQISEIFPKRGLVKILSTPKGLMTDRQAKKARQGGELICELGYKI